MRSMTGAYEAHAINSYNAERLLKPLADFLREHGADELGPEWAAYTEANRALIRQNPDSVDNRRIRYNTAKRVDWEIDPERHRRKYKAGKVGKR